MPLICVAPLRDDALAACQVERCALGARTYVDENGGVLLPRIPVHRSPRLIAQLLSHAATARGEGLVDVADAIGVDATTLMQYRSGRRRLSMQAFANILVAYGDERLIRDAAIHYARVEYHPVNADSMEAAAAALPLAVAETLRTYVERLPHEAVTQGRGLYLHAPDARALALAVQYLVRGFERTRVTVGHVRADRPMTAADRRQALAAPVLIVERIDFLRDVTAAVLRERANLVRPTVVTSMAAANAVADPHLRRVFLSRMRLIEIAPLPPPSNGLLPRESEQQ